MIVVELKPGVSWPENTALPDVRDSSGRVANFYVAKEIPSRNNQFVVGTNEDDNFSLKPNTTYAFYVRWIAEEQVSIDSQSTFYSCMILDA